VTATEYQLALINWQYFVTCTWSAGNLGTVATREADVAAYIELWVTREGYQLEQIPVALRWEKGDLGERPHAHFLIAGFSSRSVTVSKRFRQWNLWNQRHGLSDVRLCDPRMVQSAINYIVPHEARMRSASAAHVYERAKFDSADRLVINDAAWRIMLASTSDAPYVEQRATL
jgi:hypothetical protein